MVQLQRQLALQGSQLGLAKPPAKDTKGQPFGGRMPSRGGQVLAFGGASCNHNDEAWIVYRVDDVSGREGLGFRV